MRKKKKENKRSVPFLPHYPFPIRKSDSALNKPVINILLISCLSFLNKSDVEIFQAYIKEAGTLKPQVSTQ